MDIREEVPIKSFTIAAYICRIKKGNAQFLIIKRQTPYLRNSWQKISGKIEKGEKAWEAALREIKEETGLIPDRFYSANDVELFYEVGQNCINMVPVFVGFIDSDQEARLSIEHSEYKWVTRTEAAGMLSFEHQTKNMHMIEKRFVEKKPFEFLKVKMH
jgi:dATP pyrophosphohydrolase